MSPFESIKEMAFLPPNVVKTSVYFCLHPIGSGQPMGCPRVCISQSEACINEL